MLVCNKFIDVLGRFIENLQTRVIDLVQLLHELCIYFKCIERAIHFHSLKNIRGDPSVSRP